MNDQYDYTSDFQARLNEWENFRDGDKARVEEVAELLTLAANAKSAPSWMWANLSTLLTKHTTLCKDDVVNEVRRARVTAELGRFPDSAEDFVPLWLSATGHTMAFSMMFKHNGNDVDVNVVRDKMHIWCHEHGMFKSTYEAALNIYMAEEQKRVAARAYQHVAYDPSVDPEKSELRRFVSLVLAKTGEPPVDERNMRAAMAALANFIHRVKNHTAAFAGLRRPDGGVRWTHHSHLMPILYGPQKNGKTTAIKVFLGPMDGFHAGMGFDFLNHDAKLFRLSEQPIMRFDEMAGATKMDTKNLKNLMTEETRELRKLYSNAAQRMLVSTFIGCSNEDISGLIRDETGNRRFIQLETCKMDIAAIRSVDALKIWRSVDENDVAPMYAVEDDLDAIEEMQAQQRHKSVVEEWLDEADTLPNTACKATYLFRNHFFQWVEDYFPGQTKHWSLRRFAQELTRLAKAGDERIEVRTIANSNSYIIRRPQDVFKLRVAV